MVWGAFSLKVRWWDADNIWLPNQNLSLDGTIYSPSGWNKIFNNADLASDLVDYHGYMTVDSNYVPTESRSAIGSRSIVGSPDMQVAAWDYYGHGQSIRVVKTQLSRSLLASESIPSPRGAWKVHNTL